MNVTVADPTILLDHYILPPDSFLVLVHSITQDTASIVSNGHFNLDSSVGPAGILANYFKYNQLDWWAKRIKGVDAAAKRFLQQCPTRF